MWRKRGDGKEASLHLKSDARISNIVHPRAYRLLCGVAVGGALWAAIAALFGDDPTREGVNGLPLGSAHHALVLATASGLMAWAVSLAGKESETPLTRRGGRFLGRLAVMVVMLNLLLLAQPDPPPPPFFACEDVRPLGHGFRAFLNCDSSTYLLTASRPSVVLEWKILQSRPLSFALPYLISRPIHLVPRLDKAGPYRPFAAEFVAYLLVNLATLLGALLFFMWALEKGTGRPAGIELLFAFVALSANDITKLFFWTPHTQLFNLFVPCMAVYLNFRLLQRGRPLEPRKALAVGLVLGAGLLTYGAFAVPLACVVAIQLLVYRRWLPSVLVGVAAVLPYACWVALMFAITGSYYNHEVAQAREFVWMIDCARQGIGTCAAPVRANLYLFVTTAAPVVVIPALLVFVGRLARVASPGTAPSPPPAAPALGQAVALTLVVSSVFLALMGAYFPRLCWLLVPPMLLLATLEFQAFLVEHPAARTWRLNAAVVAICLVHVVVLASRQGPY